MQHCKEVTVSVGDSTKLQISEADAFGSYENAEEKDKALVPIVEGNKCSNPQPSINLKSDDNSPLLDRLAKLRESTKKRENFDDSYSSASPSKKHSLHNSPKEQPTDVESDGDDEDHEDLISKSNLYYNVRHSYFCNLCKCSAGDKALIIRHLLRAHARDRGLECPHCVKTHMDEATLKSHVKLKHSDVMDVEVMIKCEKCGHESSDDELMKFHVLRKHAVRYSHVCSCCGKCFKTQKARYAHETKTGRTRPEPRYACCKCKAVAASKEELTKHLENSHKNFKGIGELYPCEHCDLVFLQSKLLREHLPQHERDGSGYACSVCSKRISSREHLRKHERVHTGERPYVCPECGRCFALQNTMKVHALSHKGIKPYLCDLCGIGYSQRSALMIHWKGKHADLPPPPPVEISRFFDYRGRVLDNPY